MREVVGAAPNLVTLLQQPEVLACRVERSEGAEVGPRVDPRHHLRRRPIAVPFFWPRLWGRVIRASFLLSGNITVTSGSLMLSSSLNPGSHSSTVDQVSGESEHINSPALG